MEYAAEQGDIILLEGKRPALVVSNNPFNRFTNLAILCPITKTAKGFPLHVPLDENTKTKGVIMCEQGKSLDLSARDVVFLEKIPADILEEVVDIYIGIVEVIRPETYTT